MKQSVKPVRIPDLLEMKQRGEKITVLTAYDATMARLLDCAGVDAILVGDSLGMVIMGHETTLEVTLDMMVHHTRAVRNGTRHALVVADMPFLTFQTGLDDAVRNAGRLIQEGGAAAVKLEGGKASADVIARLVEIGIPVMGHIGLTPQSVHQLGGFKRIAGAATEKLLDEAKTVQQSGAFAIVLESIPSEVASEITQALTIPTIGIGAGPHCDGQVLVSYDALGLFDEFTPSFVKRYAEMGKEVVRSAREYIDDVRTGRFPQVSARLLYKIAEAREQVALARERGLTIGLVPTMGALHEGHGALMRRACEETGYVVATIFVNPTQFDRPDDFQKYPRDIESDLTFCERLGVDAVFAPDSKEMYPGETLTSVAVSGLSTRLEGEFRPGHFRGVATVVAKLFNIIPADRAYFGEKDAQQLAVIQKMAADLNFPGTIVPVPTVREPDGLAMSSRNQRLTPDQRRIAPALYNALRDGEATIDGGCRDAALVSQAALRVLSGAPEIRVEYLEVVDPATFQPAQQMTGPVRIVAAVWVGEVRLIDNLLVSIR